MSQPHENALRASRRVLRVLVMVNIAYGVAILVLLVLSFLIEGPLMNALGVEPAQQKSAMVWGMRMIAVIGILGAPLVHVMLTRLVAIVDTVHDRDPFVVENARRLQDIAGALLGVQVLHLAAGLVAARTRSEVQQLDINWSFSITPWLAVLLLFVLARVFDHGARMRADLEGTV
jgi:hypothetical protein